MIAAILAGLALGLSLAVSVGPVIFAIIKHSINNGFKAGICFVLGVSFSDILYVVIGNLASSFIGNIEEYSNYIGIGGGGLLIAMGTYGLLFKKVKISTGDEKPETFKTHHYAGIWLTGFLMNAFNPGVIIFWLTVCVGAGATPVFHRVIMFGVCLAFVLATDIGKVVVADKIRHKLTLKTVILLNKIAGGSMIIFGIVLLYKVVFDMPMGH
ncbi:Threonine/homoserine/homoserine lactone efflux protein [Chitinophaga costaii]|uniref:Threonine/homoserine/homoserine lactone efflux protein n=1 Tax=Chitinophaga costaii TaxID=1335309 RepID=A0A1C4FQC1_9BACT|nr:LysE family transporter [Chitinophaga costaii]PUZ20430.1 lysine transporter LysE [Chitinophaga costaii]SCC57795.1 Threonine/homoserine/homoserine lactone efflux protein [Chitinophaga costaii]